MLDFERRQSVQSLQLYLTPGEASQLREELDRLLADQDALAHAHLQPDGGVQNLSVSIITARKLDVGHYTELERRVLGD